MIAIHTANHHTLDLIGGAAGDDLVGEIVHDDEAIALAAQRDARLWSGRR